MKLSNYRYRVAYTSISRHNSANLPAGEQSIKKEMKTQSVINLNAYMLDMCDMLWRCRAFDTSHRHDNTSVFRDVPPSLRIDIPNENAAFSAYLHRAMLPYAYKYLQKVGVYLHFEKVKPNLCFKRHNVFKYITNRNSVKTLHQIVCYLMHAGILCNIFTL